MTTPMLLSLLSLAVALCGHVSAAVAAPKTVAILNLSEHPGAMRAAARVRLLLEKSPGLRPNTPGDLAIALEGELPVGAPDLLVRADASEALRAAEQAFAAFQSNETRAQLEKARRLLFTIAPSEASTALLADVSFRMALLHLRDENRGLAMDELQLLHRLDERSSIDPVRYPPDVVRAFKAALSQSPSAKNASLSISATYDGAPIFVDGKAVGVAPLLELPVTAGVHIVAVAAPQYQAAAQKLVVDAGARKQVRIDLEPRLQTTRALELRFEAREQGLGDEELRQAAARVTRLLGSDAVLIITSMDGKKESKVEARLYSPTLERLSFQRPVDAQLGHIFGLVLDVPRPELLDGGGGPTLVPWFKRPFIVGAIGVGATLIIAATYSFSTNEDILPSRTGSFGWDF